MPITPKQAEVQNKEMYTQKYIIDLCRERIDDCLAKRFHLIGTTGKDKWGCDEVISGVKIGWEDLYPGRGNYTASEDKYETAQWIESAVLPSYKEKGWNVYFHCSSPDSASSNWNLTFAQDPQWEEPQIGRTDIIDLEE